MKSIFIFLVFCLIFYYVESTCTVFTSSLVNSATYSNGFLDIPFNSTMTIFVENTYGEKFVVSKPSWNGVTKLETFDIGNPPLFLTFDQISMTAEKEFYDIASSSVLTYDGTGNQIRDIYFWYNANTSPHTVLACDLCKTAYRFTPAC